VVANHADESTLQELADMNQEQIGKRGWIRKDAKNEKRNLFSFSIPYDTKL
jgi:hypothetical protein